MILKWYLYVILWQHNDSKVVSVSTMWQHNDSKVVSVCNMCCNTMILKWYL